MDNVIGFDDLPEEDQKILKSLMKTEPDLITDDDDFGGQLYLGNLSIAAKKDILKACGIKTVIQIGSVQEDPRFPDEFEYHCFGFGDNPWTRIVDYLDLGVTHIKQSFKEGKPVFIHCAAGVSRSASIVIAFVMNHKGWDFEQALKYVKERRACVDPNEGFVEQLKDWKY